MPDHYHLTTPSKPVDVEFILEGKKRRRDVYTRARSGATQCVSYQDSDSNGCCVGHCGGLMVPFFVAVQLLTVC